MPTYTIGRYLRNVCLAMGAFALTTTGFSEDRDPICGKWKWISGAVHQFGPKGRIVGEKGCTWKRVQGSNPPRYIVTWGTAYVDRLHLANGGNELRGRNTDGGEVWGKRISK